MNNKTKNFFFNGLTYGLLFFSLSFVLGYYGACLTLKNTWIISVPMGLVTFIIFGLVQTRFTKSLKTLEAITIFPEVAEEVKLESPANHMVNDHLVSGKLFFLADRLIFIDSQQEQLSWGLNNQHSFKFHLSLFNAGGEFIIRDEHNNRLIFEVDDIRLWKRFLLNK